MANTIEARLTGDLAGALARYEQSIKDKVLFSGAATMANVIYQEVRLNASGVKATGPGVVTGNLLGSIYWVYSPEASSTERKTYKVSWNRRVAPHGHLIEFGTSRAPAHPFVRPAFDKVGSAIAAGMERMRVRLAEVTP